MKFGWRPFGSGKKTGRCLRKGVNEKTVNYEPHVSAGPARLEEVFFDSQVWLDSDVEDFFSVNGDFTPSRGNTPIHPSSVIQTPERLITDENHDIEPVESPTDGKRRLSELFGDEKHNADKTNEIVTQESHTKMNGIRQPEPLQRNVTGSSPYASVTSSICSSTERTPTKGLKSQKFKSGRSSPCCIPGLARSLSFGQKKKSLVPAHA